jgi:hypothetical protein
MTDRRGHATQTAPYFPIYYRSCRTNSPNEIIGKEAFSPVFDPFQGQIRVRALFSRVASRENAEISGVFDSGYCADAA